MALKHYTTKRCSTTENNSLLPLVRLFPSNETSLQQLLPFRGFVESSDKRWLSRLETWNTMSVSHFVEPCVVPCSSVSSPQIGLQNLLSAMEQAKEESRVMEMRDSVTVPPVPLKGIELSGVQKAQLRVTDIPNLISSSEFSWNVDSSESMNPSQKKHTPTERLQRR